MQVCVRVTQLDWMNATMVDELFGQPGLHQGWRPRSYLVDLTGASRVEL